ncbi:MAG: hypothetical protein HFG60_08400 [Lachnospiraceae bacterium]|nr:hypothetical protein [Lachnospiraceae bacterium]
MPEYIRQKFSSLLDHYVVVDLLLALVILTHIGVGDIRIVSLLGIFLCMVGFLQPPAPVDLWVLAPLVFYNIASMASSYKAYGNITDGYASTQAIFIILYLVAAGLKDGEQRLLKQGCVAWAGIGAFAGICQFVGRVLFQQRAWRAGGMLGNPNALGIFLVVGWFALLSLRFGQGEEGRCRAFPLLSMEPVILIALALTLSMGSYMAMAAGILVLALKKKGRSSWREAFPYVCGLLAKASLGIGTGLLIYLAAARTDVPFSCLLLLPYAAALVCCWNRYQYFLTRRPRMAVLIAALGMAVAITAIALRPSAVATFSERLEMMANGLGYFTKDPLLGVGPYQWRALNLYDGDKYFNTWHIHNVLIHIGVELGWIAMAMLAAAAVRFYRKAPGAEEKAGLIAFYFHNMIDTSFFYLGVFALALLALGKPGEKARQAGAGLAKATFAILLVVCVYHLASVL